MLCCRCTGCSPRRWRKSFRSTCISLRSLCALAGAARIAYAVLLSIQSSASSSTTPILAIAVPFVLENGVPASPPSYLTADASARPTIVLSTTFKESTPVAIEALAWALTQGFTVNIDVQSDLQQESGWESLEVLLTKATESQDAKGKIILCAYILFWSSVRRDTRNRDRIGAHTSHFGRRCRLYQTCPHR